MGAHRIDSEDLVRFENFSVRYGRRVVVDVPNASFSLQRPDVGQNARNGYASCASTTSAGKTPSTGGANVIGLFGPNGAGKTTLIRVLAGMSNRFSGTLSAPASASIAYVPDAPYLYPFLSAASCIRQFVRRYEDFDEAKAHRLVRWLKLPLDRPIGTFSKGQCEQLHLVLSFARRCPLYVLDEPLAAVDPYTRDKLLEVIVQAAGDGATILMSTHIIAEVESVFSKVIMIEGGHIIASGPVETFRAQSGSLEQAFKDHMSHYEVEERS